MPRGVICRNLLSMMPRERRRCGPWLVVICDGSRRHAGWPRDRTPPQGLHDFLLRRALEARYLPETEVV